MKLGKRIGGRARTALQWARLVESGLVPPFPDSGILKPTKTPNPPRLKASGGELEQAVEIAKWYRSTCIALVGRCSYYKNVSPKSLVGDATYGVLVDAAPLLVEHGVAPAAWTAFSIHVWQKYVRVGRGRTRLPPAPPPKWTFSSKRLRERQDWFQWIESVYLGGDVWICEDHRRLIGLYNKLQMEIILMGKTSKAEVREAMERTLPPSLFKRMIASIQAKYDVRRASQDALITNHEYIWRR